MTDALSGLLPFIFERLKIHRIEAACLPHNQASRALLAKAGFQEEGYVRRYLKINGQWQDHVLFGLLDTDPRLAPIALEKHAANASRRLRRRRHLATSTAQRVSHSKL